MRVLVTGAAGFIGSAVSTTLRAAGEDVVGIDSYLAEAHGLDASRRSDVEVLDVCDRAGLDSVLAGVDVVCHQAAMVGAGVDPSDLPRFAANNDLGTAVLLAAMSSCGVTRLVLASSMVVYGDGRYACRRHGEMIPPARSVEDLERGEFDVPCPRCRVPMHWLAVRESAALRPLSAYAASKVAQEHYVAAWARQTGSAAIALRYHNVYGAGMPADTPYSGVAAMFRSSVERGESPRVFEDGAQVRDFVQVDDVATVNRLAVQALCSEAHADFEPGSMTALNVCSGVPISILDVARLVSRGVSADSPEPVVTGQFRPGDVRHIVADGQRALEVLGFQATAAPVPGLVELARSPLRPVGVSPARVQEMLDRQGGEDVHRKCRTSPASGEERR